MGYGLRYEIQPGKATRSSQLAREWASDAPLARRRRRSDWPASISGTKQRGSWKD